MQDIEPFYNWRDIYRAERDRNSPFYGRVYDEFNYTTLLYNYFLHPQWDEFGSSTLFIKILYVNYQSGFAVIEMLGEWNDCIHNDIMLFKTEIINQLTENGINKFMLIGENILNFHASDNLYYEEWFDEIIENGGWIIGVNFREHVMDEMRRENIHQYIHFGDRYNFNWRTIKPQFMELALEKLLMISLPGNARYD